MLTFDQREAIESTCAAADASWCRFTGNGFFIPRLFDKSWMPVSELMPTSLKLSHVDARGEASMVDVSAKPVMRREAVARGEIRLAKDTLRLIESNQVAKGNVLATARIAGIQAAKRCGELIPLCHPLPITHCEVDFEIPKSRDRIVITAAAKIAAQTGIEMEALTAVSVAALTIYDMCKAVDKRMRIEGIQLVSKTKVAANF